MRLAKLAFTLALLGTAAPLSTGFAQATGAGPGAAPAAAATAAPSDPATQQAMQRVEAHITELHKRLAITAAQQQQWDAFAAIMRQNALVMEHSYAEHHMHSTSMSAIEDMRGYAAISRMHADNVDKLLPAFESLYNSMSPEQRAAADKTFQNFQHGPTKPGHA